MDGSSFRGLRRPAPVAWILLFMLGAMLRADGLFRPLDLPAWRECDVAAVARNFYREGMNPLYARIDWRGTGPGLAEMEFPALSWAMAVGYRALGPDERIGRTLVWLASLATLVVYFALAARLLPRCGALAAGLFFSLSPLVAGLGTTLQPEGFMMFFYVAAPLALLMWLDRPTGPRWTLAVLLTAAAVLAKLPAAHLGILYAGLLLPRFGWEVFRRKDIWAFAVLALLPAVAWHWHAHRFWVTYGNSLGVSNETHSAGLAVFSDPFYLHNIIRIDLRDVWMPVGFVVALIGLAAPARREARWFAACWLVAVWSYYLVASRTLCDDWADYYHIVGVPAVGLLVGLGVDRLARSVALCGEIPLLATLLALAPLAAWGVGERTPLLVLIALAAMPVAWQAAHKERQRRFSLGMGLSSRASGRLRFALGGALILALLGYSAQEARLLARRRPLDEPHPLYQCAQRFAPRIEPGALLAVSGGTAVDEGGAAVAYDAPYFLYWLDRKGFTVAFQHQSIVRLEELAHLGVRYFVAETYAMHQVPGFADAVASRFRVVDRCPEAWLVELTPLAQAKLP